jgi:hypothetical protein
METLAIQGIVLYLYSFAVSNTSDNNSKTKIYSHSFAIN